MQVNIHHAKTHLSQLIEQVEEGEEVVIARNGKPVARLVAWQEDSGPKRRRLGTMKGLIRISDDFNDPLPEDLLRLFYEGEVFSEGREE